MGRPTRRGSRTILSGLAALAALTLGPTAAEAARPVVAEDLYVLSAAAGELDRVGNSKRVFKLVLTDPGNVTVFTDRPVRRAGHQKLRSFIRAWNRLGFRGEPPNAALVIADAPNSRDVLVLKLSKPRLRRDGVAFRAKLVKGSATDALRRFRKRADRRVTDQFGQVSLFIDPGAQAVHLTFSLTNIPPRGVFEVTFLNTALTGLVQVVSTGPAATTFFSPNAIVLQAPGSSAINATISGTANVDAGAKIISGTVERLPSGASAFLQITLVPDPTRVGPFTWPVPAGPFELFLPCAPYPECTGI